MELYLIRHGRAEDAGPGVDDRQRALTSDGRRRFREVVRGLGRLRVTFGHAWHSPLKRAEETAQLLRPLCHELASSDLLAQSPADGLLALVAGASGGPVALVGHDPWLGELALWLMLGRPGSPAALLLRKGGIIHLSGDPRPGGMSLSELLRPKVLRGL